MTYSLKFFYQKNEKNLTLIWLWSLKEKWQDLRYLIHEANDEYDRRDKGNQIAVPGL